MEIEAASTCSTVARSSLAAETQALADLGQEIMFTQLTRAGLLGQKINLKQTVPAISRVPAVLITGCT